MHAAIAAHRDDVIAACRRHGVARLEVFGSGARGVDFDPARSDADFLVLFAPGAGSLTSFLDFKEDLEALLGRPVDLVERQAVEESDNPYRRRGILADAELLYAA